MKERIARLLALVSGFCTFTIVFSCAMTAVENPNNDVALTGLVFAGLTLAAGGGLTLWLWEMGQNAEIIETEPDNEWTTCPKCGAEVELTYDICPNCEEDLLE